MQAGQNLWCYSTNKRSPPSWLPNGLCHPLSHMEQDQKAVILPLLLGFKCQRNTATPGPRMGKCPALLFWHSVPTAQTFQDQLYRVKRMSFLGTRAAQSLFHPTCLVLVVPTILSTNYEAHPEKAISKDPLPTRSGTRPQQDGLLFQRNTDNHFKILLLRICNLTASPQIDTYSGFQIFLQVRVVQTSPVQWNIDDFLPLIAHIHNTFFLLSGELCHKRDL